MGCYFSNLSRTSRPEGSSHDGMSISDSPCKCCVCDRCYSNTRDLLKHVGSHDLETITEFMRAERPIVRCEVCAEEFRTVLELKKHHFREQHTTLLHSKLLHPCDLDLDRAP